MAEKPIRRSPRPKSPTEIINEQITPYDLLGVGNPNPIKDTNRGNDVSIKNNVNKDFEIGLKDLYAAVKYYICEIVKPSVIENGNYIPVPVEYAFAERWQAAQKEGFLRDKEGRILLPIITVMRSSIERNRTLGNKLDGNKVHNYQMLQTRYNRLNIYDNFSVLTNREPVKEYMLTPVPDYFIVTYKCSIFCNYQEHVDQIIQAFSFLADSYWGEYERFKFKVNIGQFTDSIQYNQGEDRSVRADFDIVLNGYLLPDTIARSIATQKKVLSPSQLLFTLETTESDIENFGTSVISNKNKKGAAIIIDSIGGGSSNTQGYSAAALIYLDTNVTLFASSFTTNTATFAASFLTAPSPLPATSLSNFQFFYNGQLIDTGIVSFSDNGNGTSTLTINPSSLGYSFTQGSTITAVGKFT